MGNALDSGFGDYNPAIFDGVGQDEAQPPVVVVQQPGIIDQISTAVATKIPGGWLGLAGLAILGYFAWNKMQDADWF